MGTLVDIQGAIRADILLVGVVDITDQADIPVVGAGDITDQGATREAGEEGITDQVDTQEEDIPVVGVVDTADRVDTQEDILVVGAAVTTAVALPISQPTILRNPWTMKIVQMAPAPTTAVLPVSRVSELDEPGYAA